MLNENTNFKFLYNLLTNYLKSFYEFVFAVLKNYVLVKIFSLSWRVLPLGYTDFTFYGLTIFYWVTLLKGSRANVLQMFYVMCFVSLGYTDFREMSDFFLEFDDTRVFPQTGLEHPTNEILKTKIIAPNNAYSTQKTDYLSKYPIMFLMLLLNFFIYIE